MMMDISIDEIKKSIEHFGRVLRSYDIRDFIENVNIDFDSLNELGIDNKAKLVAVLTLGINDDNLKKIKEKIKERKITKIIGAKYDPPINNMCGAIVFIDKIGFVEFVLILSGGRLKEFFERGKQQMRKNERKNKIKRIVDSSEIDWAGIMRCNISDRSMLCNELDEELTDSQIDSLLYETSSPLKITGVTLLCSDDEISHDIESNNIVITDRGGRPLLTIEMNWQFFD